MERVIPEQFETERLIIRCPGLEDVEEIHNAILESLDDLKPWMSWANEGLKRGAVEKNLRVAVANFITQENLRYHFHCKQNGRFLVASGLQQINWDIPSFEIGYWCRSSEQGKGYVSEGVRALCKLAFEHLKAARVSIHCDDKNHRSYKIPERLGFDLEGIHKNDSLSPSGELRSTRIYALTDASFQK